MNVDAVFEVQPDMEQCSALVFRGEHPALELIEVIDGKREVRELGRLCVERSPCGFHAADANKSIVKKFPSGRIRQFVSPVFVPERLEGVPIFRQIGSREIFVTNLFREAVERAKLTGMKFATVWQN